MWEGPEYKKGNDATLWNCLISNVNSRNIKDEGWTYLCTYAHCFIQTQIKGTMIFSSPERQFGC